MNSPKAMRPGSFLIFLTGASLVLLGGQPSRGQSNRGLPSVAQATRQPTSQQLSQQFREGFLKGCLNGKTPDVKNQPAYCSCLAAAYQSRYDGPTLAAISQLAARSGQSGPALVNVMMAPEAKSCAAKS
jgi:hypothetical protein